MQDQLNVHKLADPKDAGPLYLQIREYIQRQIADKVYNIGDILPSELEYQKQFNVCRITVRNAINELVINGLVERTRGKGTVVLEKKLTENVSKITSFSQELANRGLEAHTSFVGVTIVRAGPTVSEGLGVGPDDFVLNIRRIRGTREYPIVYADSYFTLDRNLPVDKELYYGSLYTVIQEHCGINWKTELFPHSDIFEAIPADDNQAQILGIDPGMPILKRISKTKDKDGRVFEFAFCYHRGDKFSCSVVF